MLTDASLLRCKAYIDGAWVDADSAETIAIFNPANGEEIGVAPKMGAGETRTAIEAADAAFATWSKTLAKERADLLRRWFELVLEHKEDLAIIMTLEQGKPLSEARGEIDYAASFLEWFSEEARRVYGDVIPQHQPDKRLIAIKQPVGVVGAITPWNFPSSLIARKAAPALAAGCTIVVKPASETPFSALALAELADRAGIPKGVFNVITGSAREIGAELTSNPAVRKITFTGSTEVGRILLKQSASTVKTVSMELGGNAPFIVFDDADLDAAIEGAMISKFRNTGQTCVCANRFYVQDQVYDAFVEKLTAAVGELDVKPGMEDGDQGALINMSAVETVEHQIADALERGGKITTGGARHSLGGSFFQPTVIADASQDMVFASEETFGPLAGVIRFSDEEEVIELANDTEYGLAAYFYARDIGRIWRVAEAIDAGMIGINTGLISTTVAPFGGVKQSGLGREGSKYGIDEFVEVKYLCMGL